MISFILPNHNEPNIHKVIGQIEDLFPGSQVIISCDRYGRGKGYTIRQAVKHCTNDLICFLDGDGDISPMMVFRLLVFTDEYQVVVGKKKPSGSLARKILTVLSRIYIKLLFNISVETQTGIKLFRKCALYNWKCDGWAFDIEILYKAHRNEWRMIDVPVMACVSGKIPFKSILKTLLETWRIRWQS